MQAFPRARRKVRPIQVPEHPKVAIDTVAKAARMTVKALRHYHVVGVIVPARIDESSGYRYYGWGNRGTPSRSRFCAISAYLWSESVHTSPMACHSARSWPGSGRRRNVGWPALSDR